MIKAPTHKVIECPYDSPEDFKRRLDRNTKDGWRVASVFRPDSSWRHHVVVVLEKRRS